MLSADIGFLTCSISIILQYMQATFELEGAGNDDTQWTLPSSRIARMEEITLHFSFQVGLSMDGSR